MSNHDFYEACLDGNINAVLLTIEEIHNYPDGVLNLSWGLEGACEGGHMDIINLFIELCPKWDLSPKKYSKLNFNYGLYGACQGGHINIVNLMISHGASDWNWSLKYACAGGHINIINLMISHGANDWENSLSYACQGEQMDAALLMISKGANVKYLRGLCKEEYYKRIKSVIKQLNISDCGSIVKDFCEKRKQIIKKPKYLDEQNQVYQNKELIK